MDNKQLIELKCRIVDVIPEDADGELVILALIDIAKEYLMSSIEAQRILEERFRESLGPPNPIYE